MKTHEATNECFQDSGKNTAVAAARGALSSKIQPRHQERLAVVYVRQSTMRQVHENVESTQLQYRLQERALALGWPATRVVVIDDDQGVSGQTVEGRLGFQRVLAEVSLDHVGIVPGDRDEPFGQVVP